MACEASEQAPELGGEMRGRSPRLVLVPSPGDACLFAARVRRGRRNGCASGSGRCAPKPESEIKP